MLDKLKTLDKTFEDLEKQFGKDVILDKDNYEKISRWFLSSPYLNYILGGGLPKNRITEIYGVESGGKSSIASLIARDIQNQGGFVVIIDAEHGFDYEFAHNSLGLEITKDKLKVIQPNTGEDSFTIAETLASTGNVDLIIIDSVSAMTPKAEMEGDFGQSHMGLQARMMGQGLRKLNSIISKKNCAVIFINQIRCIEENTLCCINSKIVPIKSIQIGDYISGKKVVNIFKSQDVGISISSRFRNNFIITKNHLQPVISHGEYIELKGEEIKKGDWMITPIVLDNYFTSTMYPDISNITNKILSNPNWDSHVKLKKLPRILTPTLAFLLGAYYSDGHIRDYKNNSYGIVFTETKNRERYKAIEEALIQEHFIFDKYLTLSGRIYLEFFKTLGCIRYSKNKVIPEIIMTSGNREIITSFIRGAFFDTHGFNKSGFIFTNENSDSLEQFSTLLYYLGIFVDKRKNYLYITGNDAVKFYQDIGFVEDRKQNKKNLVDSLSLNARGKYDIVPHELGIEILKFVKLNNNKNLTEYPKYHNLSTCRCSNDMNFSRLNLIAFLEYFNLKDNFYYDLLIQNRFSEIQDINVTNVQQFIDVEVENLDGLFIANQFLTHNSKIGVIYGSNETTSGGNALKFYSSIRLDVRKVENIFLKEEVTGIKTRIKNVKNKTAPPFRKCEIDISFTDGMDTTGQYIDFAVDYGIISKGGAGWFTLPNGNKVQGRDKIIAFYKSENKLFDEIKKKVDYFLINKSYKNNDQDVPTLITNTEEEIVEPVIVEDSLLPSHPIRKPRSDVVDDIQNMIEAMKEKTKDVTEEDAKYFLTKTDIYHEDGSITKEYEGGDKEEVIVEKDVKKDVIKVPKKRGRKPKIVEKIDDSAFDIIEIGESNIDI